MSLILDALRKSERIRQQTLTGQVSSVAPASEHHRLPIPWVTLFGLILLLNAIVLAVLLWRADQPARIDAAQISTAAPIVTTPTSKPVIRPLAEEVLQAGIPATGDSVSRPATMTVKPSAPAAPITSSTAVAHDPALTAAPLDTLPLAFQQSLPALHLDVHSYTHNPSDRFVVINMQRYIVGDTLKEGPRVVAITSAGVILEYQGTSFLLPRN
ncbi:MAG TPA: general secretion pathway protein GspB [Gammaproteobacteria bacterium]|jgi:hypothetical protein|nr:general secretion pathway protein GspB [Gammaproteobacteria bacterium]